MYNNRIIKKAIKKDKKLYAEWIDWELNNPTTLSPFESNIFSRFNYIVIINKPRLITGYKPIITTHMFGSNDIPTSHVSNECKYFTEDEYKDNKVNKYNETRKKCSDSMRLHYINFDNEFVFTGGGLIEGLK